ncbi:MAG TPA: ribonuclease P protein component [Candidatus Acidoferrum sp.]|nr:ribonuclease P protein component [Candidatus Acidoferrum sp.]
MIYEATISTIENSPQTAAWIPEPQLEQERAGHTAQPAPDRAQAFDAGLRPSRMGGGTPEGLGFGRASRLKQARDFARVRQEGERLVNGCLIANWRRLPAGTGSRLGVITAGRIGGAVVRNRARRLLRESFRLHQHDLEQAVELVLVARPSIVGKGFTDVERDFLTTLRKAGLLKRSTGS